MTIINGVAEQPAKNGLYGVTGVGAFFGVAR